jgi:hypothetical protein
VQPVGSIVQPVLSREDDDDDHNAAAAAAASIAALFEALVRKHPLEETIRAMVERNSSTSSSHGKRTPKGGQTPQLHLAARCGDDVPTDVSWSGVLAGRVPRGDAREIELGRHGEVAPPPLPQKPLKMRRPSRRSRSSPAPTCPLAPRRTPAATRPCTPRAAPTRPAGEVVALLALKSPHGRSDAPEAKTSGGLLPPAALGRPARRLVREGPVPCPAAAHTRRNKGQTTGGTRCCTAPPRNEMMRRTTFRFTCSRGPRRRWNCSPACSQGGPAGADDPGGVPAASRRGPERRPGARRCVLFATHVAARRLRCASRSTSGSPVPFRRWALLACLLSCLLQITSRCPDKNARALHLVQ